MQTAEPGQGIDPSQGRKNVGDLLPWLPCTVALDARVKNFTVRDLLSLRPGALVETDCHQSSDLPMWVNGLLVAWSEFEVVGEQLAARVTDLA